MTYWWSRRGIRARTPTPELRTAVKDFVGDGCGLLLMSNHGEWAGVNRTDWKTLEPVEARRPPTFERWSIVISARDSLSVIVGEQRITMRAT